MVTSTDTVGIGYNRQGHPAHPRAITTMGDDHRVPDTQQVDVMTGEAGADPMLGYTRETEVQVAQDTPAQTDTPAGTETQDRDTHLTATEPRVIHRSTSHSRHPSTDRHTSRDRNTGQRHTPDHHRTQSCSPHRQWPSNNRPPTPYTRHNSRSKSSSCNNDKPHRHSITIQDNSPDNDNQDYDNVDDFFDEDLN